MSAFLTGLANWRSATTGSAGAAAFALATALVGGQITWAQSLPGWALVAVLALWPEVARK